MPIAPGPWTIDCDHIVDAHGRLVAIVAKRGKSEDEIDNAQLIGRSTEVLRLCRRLVDEVFMVAVGGELMCPFCRYTSLVVDPFLHAKDCLLVQARAVSAGIEKGT